MSGFLGRVSRMSAQVLMAAEQPAAKRQMVTAAAAGAVGLPRVYLGTMTFAWNQSSTPVDDAAASAMVRGFLAKGGLDIDTARIYSGGDCEPMLGRVLREEGKDRQWRLATKAHPSQPKGLSAEGIRAQVAVSMSDLGVERVDVLYLHQPDTENNLTESLECVDQLVKEGKVGALGMSNYSAEEVDRACTLCAEHGWTPPSVFQGLYNPLNRMVEVALLPVLRKHNVAFIAFNPLAAGLLSGKHRPGGEVLAGRFKDNPNYLPRFYTDSNFKALERIRSACEAHSLEMVPATYAWLLRHSQLDAALGDGLLLGASNAAHLEENLSACMSPPALPAPVVAAFDGAWDVCKDDAFYFWRSHSKDHPGRESLHPGASYTAHGPK